MKIRIFSFFLLFSVLVAFQPRSSLAVSRDVRTVMVTSVYGVAAGTAMGIVAWPLTGQGKSIFLGSSIGLYLGMIAGIYHISNKDNPENPFLRQAQGEMEKDFGVFSETPTPLYLSLEVADF